jgi:hypothetical protein
MAFALLWLTRVDWRHIDMHCTSTSARRGQ